MKKIILFFFISVFIGQLNFAQEKKAATTDNSIDGQFNTLLESSNNYQDYKVVKETKLRQLQQHTVQQIKALNQKIESSNAESKKQAGKIDQLQKELQNTNAELKKVNDEKNEISFLGIPTNKNTYQSLMIGIIVVLALILVFFIVQYKKSMMVTKTAKNNLKAYEDEFDEYKRKALEKQQKLGRQLQDERNKISRIKSQ